MIELKDWAIGQLRNNTMQSKILNLKSQILAVAQEEVIYDLRFTDWVVAFAIGEFWSWGVFALSA